MPDMKPTLFLASVLVLAIFGIISSNGLDALPIYGIAFAQLSPNAGSNPDLGAPGDNSTGLPGNNSTDLGGVPGGNLGGAGQNATDLGAPGDLGVPGENTTDLGPGPAGNLTNTPAAQAAPNSTSSTVPEFGPMVSLILVASIVSIIIFSARTRLRF